MSHCVAAVSAPTITLTQINADLVLTEMDYTTQVSFKSPLIDFLASMNECGKKYITTAMATLPRPISPP